METVEIYRKVLKFNKDNSENVDSFEQMVAH